MIELPPGVEPLVLWEPPEGSSEEPVIVDTMLTRWLRKHQREGVQFLFDCVTGLRSDIGQGEGNNRIPQYDQRIHDYIGSLD